MDLVGDMLCGRLNQDCAGDVAATRLMPALRRRLTRIPLLPGKLAHNADRLMNRFVDYPAWLHARAGDYDVFHVVDHSYSQLIRVLPRGRAIVTCHDLDTFRCLLEPQMEKRPRWFCAMVRRILDGFLQAAHVIAVSGATREELIRRSLFPPERITVVQNGVHPSCSSLPDPAADAAAAQLLPPDGGALWLLSVGSTLPRKRLDVLLRVFAAVQRKVPAARLARVGGLTAAQLRLAAELGIEHSVLALPYLERDVLAAVYRSATLLLHTAEAEGFGLPLIEAMACGCPVVASDLPVLREVGGAAAIYCPVGDVSSWAETVTDLLIEGTQRQESWERRRLLGVRHATRFSWAENARQTALIYRQVLEGK
jgi:glycosyltransferase involved in cell wall biosynthesis